MAAHRTDRDGDEVAAMTLYVSKTPNRSSEVSVEEVDRAAGTYRVLVDGHERLVTWRVVRETPEMTEVSCRVDGKTQHEALLSTVGPEKTRISVDGTMLLVDCVEKLVADARATSAAASKNSGEELLAPIPGRVVRIAVELGAVVAAGTPVVILEAMKMQNELRATSDGVVAEILCTEGQTVDGGAILVRIDPPTKG